MALSFRSQSIRRLLRHVDLSGHSIAGGKRGNGENRSMLNRAKRTLLTFLP